jgi:hypothetical protein
MAVFWDVTPCSLADNDQMLLEPQIESKFHKPVLCDFLNLTDIYYIHTLFTAKSQLFKYVYKIILISYSKNLLYLPLVVYSITTHII